MGLSSGASYGPVLTAHVHELAYFLRPPTNAEQQRHAAVVVGDWGGQVDAMQIHHQGRGERDFRSNLIFQRHAKRNEMAGIVAIDLGGTAAAIEIGMEDAQSREGHEIESSVQAKMIFGDTGHAHLREVSHRGEERHAAEGKIRVHVLVETEDHRERRVVGRSGPEAKIGGKTPMCVRRIRGSGGAGPEECKEGEAYNNGMDLSSACHRSESENDGLYVA